MIFLIRLIVMIHNNQINHGSDNITGSRESKLANEQNSRSFFDERRGLFCLRILLTQGEICCRESVALIMRFLSRASFEMTGERSILHR